MGSEVATGRCGVSVMGGLVGWAGILDTSLVALHASEAISNQILNNKNLSEWDAAGDRGGSNFPMKNELVFLSGVVMG